MNNISNKKKMMFDARSITIKPCGVRNVAENYLSELCKYYDTIVLVNEDMVRTLDPELNVTIVPTRRSRFGFFPHIWVTYLVIKYKPDIFFSAHSSLPVLAILPKKRIFVCHDLFASLDKTFFSKYGRLSFIPMIMFRILSELSFLRASLVLAPSEKILESFKGLYTKASKTCVIHNGINIDKSAIDFSRKRKEILFVGNFREYKGFSTLYSAWSILHKLESFSDWKLNVVTNETKESIEIFINEHGVIPGISFHSRVDDFNLKKIRSHSIICVIPSNYEGFGIPLIESIASGSYTIHSDIKVFSEILKGFDNFNIRSFPAGNAKDLSLSILKVVENINNEDISDNFKRSAVLNKDRAEVMFSWGASANKAKDCINEK
jgi:glycosyltransferase involved in cell wall biosynthesis